jgi:pyroglutamyl-peptidase
MKVLITAFGSFPGVEENPSELLLAGWSHVGHEVVTQVLPVEYASCESWARQNISADIDYVIHLGVAVNRVENNLETIAQNKCGVNKDAAGEVHESVIEVDGEARYETGIDVKLLQSKLSECGFVTEISNDAGDYLCNFIYYKTLEHTASLDTRALFIHIPPLSEISLERQNTFLTALLDGLRQLR